MPCSASLRVARALVVCFCELVVAPVFDTVGKICFDVGRDEGDLVFVCFVEEGELVIWVRTADMAGMCLVVPAVSSTGSRPLSLDHEGGLSWEGT